MYMEHLILTDKGFRAHNKLLMKDVLLKFLCVAQNSLGEKVKKRARNIQSFKKQVGCTK